MKSNMITKMITLCLCMVVVGFAKQKGQDVIQLEQNTVIVKDQSYYDNLLNQMTNHNGDESKVVVTKPNPDQEKIDYYSAQGIMRADVSLNDPESCPPHAEDRDTDVWLLMMDSYGDGWNGNEVCIGGSCSGLTSGSSGWASYGSLEDGSYAVTCGGGSYMGEVSWQIQDCCYGVLLEGACPFDGELVLGDGGGGDVCEDNEISLSVGGGSYCSEVSWDLSDGSSGGCGDFDLCLADGDYTFNGYDSWGDGWNGNTATFSGSDGAIASFAVEGSSGSWTLTIGGAPPVGGCTDAGAPNYNPDAEVDDGSCEFYCSESQFACASGDQCVSGSYACDGSSEWGNAGWGPDCADGSDEALETCCDIGDATYPSDCAGTCLGSATEDCAGTCGGSAVEDECGDCGGDGSACSCDGEYLTVYMTDSWGDGWDGASFCINDECTTVESGSTADYTFCVDLSASNDVTCGGGNYAGEHSWELYDEAGNLILSGGDPYAGCLGDCGVGGCMDANSDNYNSDATYDDGSCNAYIGMDCAYFGQSGIVDCDLYYCVPSSWLGDGGCDASYFACAELGCDGGDCEDCAGECLGSAADDACGNCNGDCTESGGSCSDTDNGAADSYGDACSAYTNYPSWCGGYDDDDFDSMSMCCACGGGEATAGAISCGDGSCDCDGNVDAGCGCGEAGPSGCDNACGSTLENDECGVCGGGGIADGACDCDGNVADCNGDCGGDAAADNCGTCDSDPSNDCADDCAGVPGGDSFTDCSGNCVAGWLMSYLGDGWCDGSSSPYGVDLSCNDCDNGDCAGLCGCEDDSSCNDECGVPNGDGSSCADCAGTPNGDAEPDYCGVCEGDNVANECCDDSDGCLMVSLVDSYGDGWNGNLLTIGSEVYTIADGASAEFSYCGGSDVAVTCGGGSWMSEVSWSISNCDGIVLEGGAPYDGCLGDCPDDGGDDGGGEECVNDDSTSDAYGDTCTSWYDAHDYPGSYGCEGGYNDDDFDAGAQCCVCQGAASSGDDDVVYSSYSAEKLADLRAYDIEQQFRIDNPIATPDASRDDCGGSGPDVGCDGVCFSGAEDVGCGCGEGLNDEGCCGDESADCSDTCGGTYIEDCSDEDCGGVSGWVGDGLCDGASQAYGYDLTCYECDGGDCLDDCGECDGDNSSCSDCCGVPNGDNSTCGGSGDVDGSTTTDVLDVVYIVGAILGTDTLSECDANEADVGGDGTVNVLDVIAIVELILSGYTQGCTDPAADNYDPDADADDGSCTFPCDEGYVDDCSGDGDCCPGGWIGDSYCDGEDQAYGCDLMCYDEDGGDCAEADCALSASSFTVSGSTDIDGDGYNDDCYSDGSGYYVFDWDGGCQAMSYCDDATGECADLSAYGFTGGFMYYGFDGGDCQSGTLTFADGGTVSGSACVDCPAPEDCAGTSCGYWINYGYTCEDLTGGFGYDCSLCEAEGGCPSAPSTCAETSCGGYLDSGYYTCDDLAYYGIDCALCDAEGACDVPAGCSDTQFDCNGDGSDCIPASYVCDGSSEHGNAGWPADCANGADEVIEDCCAADDATYTGAGLCGGEACENDDSTEDNWGYTCTMNGSTCYGGYYDDDDFDECAQCCACEGDSDCAARDAVSNNLKLITIELQNSDPQIEGKIHGFKYGKNPADVIQPKAPLGRKAAGFESKLQRAGSVQLVQTNAGLSYEADGFVGFEITLEHGADFGINVTESAFIAEFNTVGNTTRVIVVHPETAELFNSTGDYKIVDVIAGTKGGEALSADIVTVKEFGLSNAYPNPFNPTTSVELGMPADGFVSIKIYNIMGQVVATLHEGNLTANNYSFTWDAVNAASGMYFLKAETASNVDVQKIMLMK